MSWVWCTGVAAVTRGCADGRRSTAARAQRGCHEPNRWAQILEMGGTSTVAKLCAVGKNHANGAPVGLQRGAWRLVRRRSDAWTVELRGVA